MQRTLLAVFAVTVVLIAAAPAAGATNWFSTVDAPITAALIGQVTDSSEGPCGGPGEPPCEGQGTGSCGGPGEPPCEEQEPESCGGPGEPPCEGQGTGSCGGPGEPPCEGQGTTSCGGPGEPPCEGQGTTSCGGLGEPPCDGMDGMGWEPCGGPGEPPCEPGMTEPGGPPAATFGPGGGGAVNIFLPDIPECGAGVPATMPALFLACFAAKVGYRRRRGRG